MQTNYSFTADIKVAQLLFCIYCQLLRYEGSNCVVSSAIMVHAPPCYYTLLSYELDGVGGDTRY